MISGTAMAGRDRRQAGRSSLFHPFKLMMTAIIVLVMAAAPASALSEIKREELPPPTAPATPPPAENPEKTVPLPDPIGTPDAPDPDKTGPGKPDDVAKPDTEGESTALPEVLYDFEKLPPEVKRMRQLIIEACESGDAEKLRPLIGLEDDMTQLSLTDIDGDPIAFIKGLSGDPDGLEILAIMEEVLNAGYVHLDAGTPEELYVWPYFFAIPLDKLTVPQRVELFKIVTAGDYDEMKNYGSYMFYRVGITPQGKWAFFVAGE